MGIYRKNKHKYVIRDEKRVLVTVYGEIEMENAWSQLTGAEENINYTHLKPKGNLVLSMVIGELNRS